MEGSNASCGLTDQKLVVVSNSCFSTSTVTLQSTFSISIKLVFLKSSTKNPVLNLDKPSASCI